MIRLSIRNNINVRYEMKKYGLASTARGFLNFCSTHHLLTIMLEQNAIFVVFSNAEISDNDYKQ